ncbi:MAG: threonine synthase [Mariprofundus sp.]|nr:threonine synthase [Mariprofundus sp.]
MTASTLIVTQALLAHQDGVSLHPDLFLWEKYLSKYRQTWFRCSDKNPLAWYAALSERPAALLLAEKCSAFPEHIRQCWVVSPYHAFLAQHMVRVHPEGLFSWSAEDARYLCETVNPFIADDGMTLISAGSALLLCCREPMQAYPQGFAAISGKMLPDCDHEGEDGGRLNRLLSEIQMLLFQHPSAARQERGDVGVSGIWVWDPVDMKADVSMNVEIANGVSGHKQFAVATRNPLLQSLVEPIDADLIISEPERMHELLQHDEALPKTIILAGEGHAVLLKQSIFPSFTKGIWKSKLKRESQKEESTLLAYLVSVL